MGHDDVDGAQLLPGSVVVYDVSRSRLDADRLRLQRPRRRIAGRSRPALGPPLDRAPDGFGGGLGQVRPINWEPEEEDRASTLVWLGPDASSVGLHDVLGYRQTQPGPHRTSRAIRLVKPLEEAGKLAWADTDAGTLNLEFDCSIDRGGDHLDRAPAWSELDRVVDQVEEDLIHPGAVGRHHRRFGRHGEIDNQSRALCLRRHALNDPLNQGIGSNRLERQM